jgi:hypothetical protein
MMHGKKKDNLNNENQKALSWIWYILGEVDNKLKLFVVGPLAL